MTAAVAEAPRREVILIDFSSLFWTAWHSSGEDEISQARKRTLESVRRAADIAPGALVAICCDSGRSFRKDLHPEYKANRPEKDHASLGELARTKEQLRADGYLLWEASGFEADDIIATATLEAARRGHEVTIASADKDLLQLLRPGVRALRTHNWTVVGLDEARSKFGVDPEQLGDWLALVGDSSDNIKGTPGIGPKRATELLGKFYSLTGLWAALEKNPASVATPAVVKSLQENRAAVELAQRLVDLRTDVPLKFDELYEERKPTTMSQENEDMDKSDPAYDDAPISRGPGTPPPEMKPEEKTPAPEATPPPAAPANGNGAVTHVETTAMVPALASVGPYEQALEPSSLGVAFKLGAALYASRLYTRFPTAEAITAVIIRGRELGLGALTSLDSFHLVEGRPSPHAHLIISMAERHPECDYFMLVHSDNTYAEYETKNRRHPRPIKHRYTIDQAIDAGLCTKEIAPRPRDGKDSRSNWDKRRAEMLRKTCGVQLVRIAYPSAAMGLYAIEELGGEG